VDRNRVNTPVKITFVTVVRLMFTAPSSCRLLPRYPTKNLSVKALVSANSVYRGIRRQGLSYLSISLAAKQCREPVRIFVWSSVPKAPRHAAGVVSAVILNGLAYPYRLLLDFVYSVVAEYDAALSPLQVGNFSVLLLAVSRQFRLFLHCHCVGEDYWQFPQGIRVNWLMSGSATVVSHRLASSWI